MRLYCVRLGWWGVVVFLVGILGGVVEGQVECVSEPWLSYCVNYSIPDANLTRLNEGLCMMEMTECTVRTQCENPLEAYGEFCDSFSIYKSLCISMPMMGGCKSYNSMCTSNGSRVAQCHQPTLPLPTISELQTSIVSICQMGMDGCSACSDGKCKDPLLTYSFLCYQMSEMKECSWWKNYCALVPGWGICTGESPDGGGGNTVPMMRMYFHLGITDYILFQEWVPQTSLSYALSVIAVFLMAFLHEGIRIFKIFYDTKERLQPTNSSSFLKGDRAGYGSIDTPATFPPWILRKELLRALYRGVDMTLHFLIMLVTMTFNVGLFVAVIGGYVVCHFLFGRYSATYLRPLEEDCH